ncbi:1-deoxy-D-xylulose-5-phosphate synthase [Roseburia sp. CAG:309]|nr:1-deoxy-D-xylulose-5-phosphate synthase [Roseburia sp. CAG:309]
MSRLLDEIKKENDIKNIPPQEYRRLAKEIRFQLVKNVSRTGGHLASNLGAVELTMALHLFLDFPKDKLVWDVGHQAYVHKMLTGRLKDFRSLRRLDGLSGFPKVSENPADTFNTGHSSTSLSVALGLAKARDLRGSDEKVVAVIGDGALSGGMAFEALNNAEQMKSNLIMVLNDNKMSISKNVGGMARYLGKVRTNRKYNDLKVNIEERLDRIPNVGVSMAETIKNAKNSLKHLFVPGMFFEEMGIVYVGPIDGHDVESILTALEAAARMKNRPVLIHVVTKKGKGYRPAEENPSIFHGVGPFDPRSGEVQETVEETYTDVFGNWMIETGKAHEELVSVCAAMPDGTGVKGFAEAFPKRFFDVGIAEEHAVTFAAGLMAGGLRPVVSIYSTFLQRAYDQMIHDVCLNNLPVIFAVDRSGIVGRDGDTHQGIFDISYLTNIPNMTVVSPMDKEELIEALDFAYDFDGPVAVRYPRGAVYKNTLTHEVLEWGKAEALMKAENPEIVIFAVGDMVQKALQTAGHFEGKVTVVNMRFVKPFDRALVRELAVQHDIVVTMEDSEKIGGFGQQVESYLMEEGCIPKKFINCSVDDCFVEHGSPEELYARYEMDAEWVVGQINEVLERK